ncbi:MAG: hypothetical protein KBB86_00840 [Candidatus Pacebacteria bacterium]|nr:hypothetical protein [Candidatus Paceibacterota bacterium]
MKQINDYLNNILKIKSKPLLIKIKIIEIVLKNTGVVLKKEEISIVGDVLKIKTKPILKHKIGLSKNIVLEEIDSQLNLKLKDVV